MTMRRILRIIALTLFVLLILLACLCAFGVKWMFATWTNLQMDELLYTIFTLSGTGHDMIINFITNCLIPAIGIFVFVTTGVFIIRKKRPSLWYKVIALILVAVFATMGISGGVAWNKLGINDYIQKSSTESRFIEFNYVDPAEITLTFPEQKRNLIYIFLESVEITFADIENGGAFEENVIPELTTIAMDYEDFSGETGQLNGARVLPGATWTIAGMFAQTAGLPLKIRIGDNDMRDQESFFSGATTMGDILASEGYNQTLMVGSESLFGGRKLYFTQHGNFKVVDLFSARADGLVAPDYYNQWWGFEDYMLFDFAQDELTRLHSLGQPFNLTLLTVDTHWENGFICEYCPDTYDHQYSNTFACTSNQVRLFLDWVMQQPFYENTTVVIAGDHCSMNNNYCADIDSNYIRKTYVAVLNSAVEPESNGWRTYSTFDLFPTTLAAMGVKIPGDRLGLGTNLFSDSATLIEMYDIEYVSDELRKDSEFMHILSDVVIPTPSVEPSPESVE